MTEISIVGAGLTGATIARCLTDAGHDVVLFEARNRVAGNCYDEVQRRCLINAHGPHYFRTNSEAIFAFASRFADWRPWSAYVQTKAEGRLWPWPLSVQTIAHYGGPDWRNSLYTNPIRNFEDACLAKVPERVYRLFVKSYTEKQWGVPAQNLSARLAARFEPREGDDTRFMAHRFQALPEGGYTQWITRMLDGISVERNVKLTAPDFSEGRPAFFTGPIDEFFAYCFGRLRYRRQKRTTSWFPKRVHPVPQVNDPDPTQPAIREIDWSWMNPAMQGCAVTTETPAEAYLPEELEYPFPDQENSDLYARYATHASETFPEVVFCGRLGSYRYLDMDQAVGQGLSLARRWMKTHDLRR